MSDAHHVLRADGGQVAQTRQASVGEVASDGPTTGVEIDIDGRTHYAHARYAASNNEPGTIWYDPRDGLEYLVLDADTSKDTLDLGEKVPTVVKLYGHRNRCGIVDPSEKWVLEVQYARKEEVAIVGDIDKTVKKVRTYGGSDVFESQQAAREAAAERFEEYRRAEWRNAVEYRLGDSDDE